MSLMKKKVKSSAIKT